MPGVGLRQAVTDAAHGFDALGTGARAPDLLAHIGHLERAPVGIRHQTARSVALPAQLQHELGLAVHPVAGLDQAREQGEFAPRQQATVGRRQARPGPAPALIEHRIVTR